jgi:isopentenyl phosphate kinase
MLIFVKFGGSLITDKTQEGKFLADRMAGLAAAVQTARQANPALQLVIGHGSGSFGHFAASKHGTVDGVRTADQWQGFAEVSRVATQLNRLVADALADAGVPVWSISPSASAEAHDGDLRFMEVRTIRAALEHGLVPLVHGDVALDTVRGGTIISTEVVFRYLAPILCPQHIFLLGEVPGVLDAQNQIVPRITPETLPAVQQALGGSHGVDVTGGMASKVQDMLDLSQVFTGLQVHIFSGLDPSALQQGLSDPGYTPGTVIASA